LVVAVRAKEQEQSCAYVLSAGGGRVAHVLRGVSDVRVADLNGDGIPELFYLYNSFGKGIAARPVRTRGWIPGPETRASTGRVGGTQLRVLRGTAVQAWRWLGTWEPAADRGGDGVADLVRREGDRVVAISVRTGRPLWRKQGQPIGFDPRASELPEALLSLPPRLAELDGRYFGVDVLISVADGKVRVTRSGVGELWTWPRPGARPGARPVALVEVWPARRGRPGTVVVWCQNEGCLVGLDVRNGTPRWHAAADGAFTRIVAADSAGEDRLPLAVSLQPDGGTVCRSALPATELGTYRPTPGRPREYDEPADDPRRLEVLPWVQLPDAFREVHRLWVAPFLGLVVCVAPVLLLRRAERRRSWRLALATLLGLAALLTGLSSAFAWEATGIAEFFNYRSLAPWPDRFMSIVFVSLLGVPYAIFFYFALVGPAQSVGVRVLTLAVLFLVGCAVAGFALALRAPSLEPGTRYTWEGWYLLWLPGLTVATCLLVAWLVVRSFWRRVGVLRRIGRRGPAVDTAARRVDEIPTV
jgi:hypothetical protein